MISIEQSLGLLNISYINKEGTVSFKEIEIPKKEMFEWVLEGEKVVPGILSWDGKPVYKKRTNFLNRYRVSEFLIQQPKEVQDEIFQFNIPQKYFCDIETEILNEFPTPEKANAAITSISIVNMNDVAIVLSMKKLSKETIKTIELRLNEYFKPFGKTIRFKYKYYETEYDLLTDFFLFTEKMPLITGWNFIDFDWNYLIARGKKLKVAVERSSPTQKLDNTNKPLHKIVVDYLRIYKKWDTIVDIKETNGLDAVSKVVLGVKKVKYHGSLNDLYRNDFEKFILYNAVDSFLVKLLDERLNTLIPYLKLGHITKTEADKAFSPVNMVENIMLEQLWNDKKRVFTIDKEKKDNKIKYEGAVVFEPTPGFYNYLGVFDYASLYPTTIRQWNISPDVYLGKDRTRMVTDDVIKCSSGAFFKKDEDGVLRILLTKIFNQRKEEKTKAGLIKSEISELTKILKNK